MRIRLLRILVPTAGMSILLLLLGGVAAWYLHGLQRKSSQLLVDSVAKVEAAEELAVISQQLCYQLAIYQSTQGAGSLDEVHELRETANELLSKAAALADTDQETRLIETIDKGHKALFEAFDSIVQEPHSGEQRAASLNQFHAIATNRVLDPARELLRMTRRVMDEASQQNEALADRMGMGLLLLGSCGAVAGLLAGYGIARGIHRSLAQLTVPVRDATGRLNEVVGPVIVSEGETFEELESSLQRMADRIGEVVRQLQESQLAATRAQQLAAMGQLAAGLAHELRNPLTSMKMLVQSGEAGSESVELDNQDLTVLRQEIDRLETTIQVFLDYARPPTLQKRQVVLREILTQTIEFLSPRAKQLGVNVDIEMPDELVEIEADVGQIRQVLLNLVINALEVSAEGRTVLARLSYDGNGRHSDRTTKAPADTSWLVLEILDEGPGLPPDLGDRIFEPFVSTKDSGTGLGLPICRRIVEEHGGELYARNRDGGGAAFVVWLPVPDSATRCRLTDRPQYKDL